MFTIRDTRSRERARHKTYTGRESFGRAELSSRETITPTVVDGTRGATHSGMPPSGKE